MNHLGIVVAMPAEARSLTKRPIPFGKQVLLQKGVSIYLAGVGPTRSHLAAEALLAKGTDALLSWGSAGGLVPNLSPGSIVLPKTVIASDQTTFHVDLKWHEYLRNQLAGRLAVHTDPLAESPVVLASPAAKKAVFRRTGAVAVDMESTAIVAVAHEANVPVMVIRAVADTDNRTIPQSILAALDGSGRLASIRLIRELAKHPIELFALVRVGMDFRAAQRALLTVAHLMGNNFLIP